MGSEDIYSGEGSQSHDDDNSESEVGGPSSGRQGGAEGSEGDEDEVGDLSWEAVMAAVQGGGSDDDAEEAVPASGHTKHTSDAELENLPKKAMRGKSRKSLRTVAAGQLGKAAEHKSSQLGKRSRRS